VIEVAATLTRRRAEANPDQITPKALANFSPGVAPWVNESRDDTSNPEGVGHDGHDRFQICTAVANAFSVPSLLTNSYPRVLPWAGISQRLRR
jgi:hypothetical protein